MYKFFDILKSLYTKNKINIDISTQLNLTLAKWLSYDNNNLKSLKKILKYQFYLTPKHFFYLLYFNIPKKSKAPFLKKRVKQKEKEDKLLNKVQYVLGWSKNDLRKNNRIINETIMKNKKEWKKELGIK